MPDRTGTGRPATAAAPGALARGARTGPAKARRVARALLAALLGTGLLAPAADARVARGDPAARLPEGSLAGEYWDVAARFESGHVLVATVALVDNGLRRRNAIAVGELLEPDGTRHRFSRSEREGGWRLEQEGRRLDLHSIVLDQAGDPRRFVVDKDELGIELEIASAGAPAWPEREASPGCGFDVLEVAGPATARFRRAVGAEPVALRGLAAVTHRWTSGLEVACLRRGVELFAMQPGLGLYFRQSETPDGARHTWLLVRQGARTVFEGTPRESALEWRGGAPGYPEPATLRFAAPGVEGRVAFGAPLAIFEPLARLPAPLRALLELRTRPRLAWSRPRFELRLAGRALRGDALAKLAWTNPQPEPLAALPAALAVHSATEGE